MHLMLILLLFIHWENILEDVHWLAILSYPRDMVYIEWNLITGYCYLRYFYQHLMVLYALISPHD